MTAGDAADILRQLGITLIAQHPEAPLERDRAAALVATFGESFKAQGAGVAASANVSTIRETAGTPVADGFVLEPCLQLPKMKDCKDCCRALGFPNRVCGKGCNSI